MDLASRSFLTAIATRGILWMVSVLVKGCTPGPMAVIMMVIGKMVGVLAMEYIHGLMVIITKVSGQIM